MHARAQVLGRRQTKTMWGEDRYYTWLRIPGVFPDRILTMVATDDDFLPHGTKTADAILVDVDPQSLRQHASGLTADVKVLDVWSGTTTTESGEAEQAEGGRS